MAHDADPHPGERVITLPNTYLAREPVVNYSRPDPRYGDTLRFHAAYESPPYAVKRAVDRCFRPTPRCWRARMEVRTRHTGERVEYAIRYWIDDFTELERIRDRLMTNMWYALRRADIRIPFRPTILHVHGDAQPELARAANRATLGRVPLLAPLAEDDIRRSASSAQR